MEFLGEVRVAATIEDLRTLSYFIHGIGERLLLTEEALFDIDLAVEEAAANIVNHAYPPEELGEILLRAESKDNALHITLTDWGHPLDPRTIKPFDVHAPVEVRAKGGMGLHLIHTLMDAVIRHLPTKHSEPNALTLVKRIERLHPGGRRPSLFRELNAMLTISRIMSANLELDDLLELILNKLVETIDAERGTLYLIDEEKGELFSRILLEDTGDLQEIRLKISEGIAGYVAATGEVLNIAHAYDDPRFLQAFDKMTGYQTNTILTAPMRNPQQKIIGVVQLLNKKGGPFTNRDERLLMGMASQAAISIENARLYAQELQQQLLNQELETARTIQTSFLPEAVPQHEGWDIAAYWRPMYEVAGDFYDFYTLPDGRLALIIADVSGKGVPAALFMALCVTVLRFAMSLYFPPDELMDRVNQAIIANQQSRMFATVFVSYVDLEKGILQYASAGHNPPLLYRAATGTCEFLEADGVAVGIFKSATYADESRALEKDDILVLYTDGITEVIKEDEEEFGEQRLQALVIENAHYPAEELAKLIVEAATAFAQDRGAIDDETLVILKRIKMYDSTEKSQSLTQSRQGAKKKQGNG